jgi:hypothetical protein
MPQQMPRYMRSMLSMVRTLRRVCPHHGVVGNWIRKQSKNSPSQMQLRESQPQTCGLKTLIVEKWRVLLRMPLCGRKGMQAITTTSLCSRMIAPTQVMTTSKLLSLPSSRRTLTFIYYVWSTQNLTVLAQLGKGTQYYVVMQSRWGETVVL